MTDENQLNRIEDKLEKISDKLNDHSTSLAVQEQFLNNFRKDLGEHVKKTTVLEGQMDTALLPIKASKWVLSVAAGITTIIVMFNLIKK